MWMDGFRFFLLVDANVIPVNYVQWFGTEEVFQ